MSLYLPLAYQTAISCADRFRMRRVRVRIDHYWAMDGRKRPEGVVAFLGNHAEVTDCDILAKGTALVPREYCSIARCRIMAGKTNCPLGGAQQVLVEDNHFVSLYPTAYQNISGSGRNLYYAESARGTSGSPGGLFLHLRCRRRGLFRQGRRGSRQATHVGPRPGLPGVGAGEKRFVAEGGRMHSGRPRGRSMAQRRLEPGTAMDR